MKKSILFLPLLLSLSYLSAQTFDKTKLNNYFDTLARHNKYMGSVAVSRNGEIVYTKAIGYASMETNTAAAPETRYRIGSISKTYTTVLVFKAIEENKLSLEQSIANYFPSIPNAGKITIRHLLSHRSGIHNFTDDSSYVSWHTQKKTEAELVDMITRGGSDFEPGSKAIYSNSNFVLLSFLLQKIYGKPYSVLLDEKIVKPIGVKDTYLGSKITPVQNEAASYRYTGKWEKETETDISIPLGAGGIVSTASDLTRFADALFNGKLVSAQSLQQMQTLQGNFGMGLFMIPFYDKKGYGHTGGIDGFNSIFIYYPEDKTAYALVSNGSNFVTNNITLATLAAVFDKPYDIPSFQSTTYTSEELDAFTGVYATSELPVKITISRSGTVLKAHPTGQSAFTLEASTRNVFRFDVAGVVMTFIPETKEMVVLQAGRKFNFKKE
jgi:D-alanyl-D-alanine carboxypeptidase